jgi:hypothetical protein
MIYDFRFNETVDKTLLSEIYSDFSDDTIVFLKETVNIKTV